MIKFTDKAKQMGISYSELYKLMASKQITYIIVGKYVYF